jgi:hypothetical protein
MPRKISKKAKMKRKKTRKTLLGIHNKKIIK